MNGLGGVKVKGIAKFTTWLAALLLSAFVAGCGDGGGFVETTPAAGGGSAASASAKAITAYSIGGATGIINEPALSIAVTVPNGTALTALVASFTHTGTGAKVGTTLQTSAASANDFTAPVAYTVTAADGSSAIYTVTVTVASVSAKASTGFSFAGLTGATGTIDEAAKTIAVTVPSGTDVKSLVATFATTGTTVKVGTTAQTSGVTANDFTNPVAFTVTAADGTTATYTASVTVASASAKAISAYSFVGFTAAAGTIDEAAKTISVTLPSGTAVTALVATFTSTGASVKVGATAQSSAATGNNFTAPVAYTVTAADGSSATYSVSVTLSPSSAKASTAFSFAGLAGSAGTINEAARTIAVTVPFGTDVRSLAATFATTGASVKVGAVVQTSNATLNNFTNPVAYVVAAADGSTTTYTVSVSVAQNSAKAIAAYSFVGFPAAAGIINETAKTIAVNLPFGTNVSALVATFTTTGTSVKVGAAVQTSTATANNFTAPVAYVVTAADGTTATYTVTVSVALSSAKVISAYSFAGFAGDPGVIDETASPKTIVVNLPKGTNVGALIATYTTTGAGVKVGAVAQTSTVTANNFTTGAVAYSVSAADGSTATYNVSVTFGLGPAPVLLGTAGNFVILAKTGVSTVPSSAITGDVGVSPAATSFLTGFSLTKVGTTSATAPQVTGNLYGADMTTPTNSNLTTAVSNMEAAYTDAATRPAPADFLNLGTGEIGGKTLTPGLYAWTTGVTISSDVTITGGSNDVWIFQIPGNLTVSAAKKVILGGSAKAKNIFWQFTGFADIGAGAHFEGIMLSQTAITLKTGASMNGRALAQTAVALDQNPVTQPAP